MVGCKVIGAIAQCSTTCVKQTGCSATSGITTTATVPWTVVNTIPTETTAAAPTPECNMDDASGLPYNVFQGVYGQFGDEVDKGGSALKWIVDSHGNRIPPKKRDLQERTPPPNPDTYKNYMIDLMWSPLDTGATCTKSCSEAYGLLANGQCKLNDESKRKKKK